MTDAAATLADAARLLQAVSETPRLDAELLMAHAAGMERGAMLLRLRDLAPPDGFDALLARRLAHEPVAYIVGTRDFWDLTLNVSPAVLIPRADSETLIEAARDFFSERQPKRIIDLGTGSGALLLSALSVFPNASGIGLDASAAALAIASENAAKLGLADRCEFIEASWHDADWTQELGRFDLILCNPPYVESAAELDRQVSEHEPASALFAGEDGLDDYRVLMPQISALLAPNGLAVFELGRGQDDAVGRLASQEGFLVQAHKDLAGIIRVLAITQPNCS